MSTWKYARESNKIVRFNFIINDTDWKNLRNFLRLRENKIIYFNFSNSEIDEYFLNFLEVMNEVGLFCYFQFIEFGRCKLDSQRLIKLTNLLISNYSEIERSYPTSIFRYLLCWDNMIHFNNRLNHITRNLNAKDDK